YVLSWSSVSTCTRGTFRRDFQVISSSRCATTRTGRPRSPIAVASTATASLVRGTSPSTKPLTTWTRPWLSRSDSAPRGGLHLLRRPLRVGTRLRAVHDAAARVLGRAQRALAGPAGALLAVRLLAAAAHLAAGLGGVGTLAGRRLLRHHDLVDQRHVHLGGEDLVGEFHRLFLSAYHADRGHQATSPSVPSVLAALRTSTTRPLGPGTAPLIRSSPRSASTACTVSDCTVVRTPPIRPAIRTPLNTRPGVAHAPMEPGERCLRWVPCAAPRPLKPCRFITPALPLPLL